MSRVLDAPFAKGFIHMAQTGWNLGWHERNGGNLSYRLKSSDVEAVKDDLCFEAGWNPAGAFVPDLAGEFFLITGSGKFFSNIKSDPAGCLGLIQIDEQGKQYRIVWGLENGGMPTSELPSHLMNHAVKRSLCEDYRVIYHAHTTNLIALTFVLPLRDEVFTRELWEMATECPVIFPAGVGVVGWMVPGQLPIAKATSEKMKEYDLAIWAHHGTFAAGSDFDATLGLMHTAEKAAEILVKVISMTGVKRQTIQPEEFRALEVDFNVELPEKFLYEKDA
ncbi:MAG: rhamnulose-1-phosphate aldolase [Erysipelotrichaceae bacterium]|nr:rhamnulose-1-phosphate aldolase [Erysipelotrichaceae bacterium]